MSRSKRGSRPFSLVEILVSLSILALISSLISVKVCDLLKKHRFSASVDKVYSHIKLMQVLSVAHGIDTYIHIQSQGGKVRYRCYNEAGLSKGALFSSQFSLDDVQSISLAAKPLKEITLMISSTGRIYPQGSLFFHSSFETTLAIDTSAPFLLAITTPESTTTY